MKSKEKAKYITFPIAMLKGFEMMDFKEVKELFHNVMGYCLYLNYQKFECIVEASNIMGVEFGNAEISLSNGEKLYKKFEGQPLVSVNKDIVFRFYKKEKSNYEKLVFAVFCGLRSILGKSPYYKSNNNHVIARTLGFRDYDEFERTKDSKECSNWYGNYFSSEGKIKHHLTDKIIKKELCLEWGLKYYGLRCRGFFFGFKISQEDLIFQVEVNRKRNKIKKYEEALKQDRERALKRL